MKISTRKSVALFAAVYFFMGTTALALCDVSRLQPVRFGQKSPAVKNMQECMVKFGYSNQSGATGFYWNETQYAVKRFYDAMTNVQTDGKVFGASGIKKLQQVFVVRAEPLTAARSGLMKKVASSVELRDYFAQAQQAGNGRGNMLRSASIQAPMMAMAENAAGGSVTTSNAQQVSRSSDTNVQVKGIDEPDIIKTDGESIFFSSASYYGRPMPMLERRMAPMQPGTSSDFRLEYNAPTTKVIDALPAESVAVIGSIPESGNILLVKGRSMLIVSRGDGFTGYDVSNPRAPVKKWTSTFEQNSQLTHTRLLNGNIYAIIQKWQGANLEPCPLRPMKTGGTSVVIACGDVWRPNRVVSADSLYSVLEIDAATGLVSRQTAFVGASGATVYVSPQALYVAYQTQESESAILARVMTTDASALFSKAVISRIQATLTLAIGETARDVELREIIENYYRTLSSDNRLTIETKLQNSMSEYRKKHLRDFEKTIIARIPFDTLSLTASGEVPGHLLNQFSLDEYQGYLRVATTVGGGWWGSGRTESENDVYVLDARMRTVGKVQGLGLTERIYSARFIGNKGYLVTFRQTDPFYILDLAIPTAPKMTGELKIPGFSSYLHPLTQTLILGVGRDEGKVKLSLFDVSDKYNPKEISKFMLDEGWTEVENNHHAFLQDDAHSVFFIPGSKGGYVISYAGSKLELKQAISQESVQRAVYVNDFLYVVGGNQMSIWNEKTWEKVSELTF